MADDIYLTGTGVIASRRGAPVHLAAQDPALDNSMAVSLGEVEDLIAESSAGFIRSMNPKDASSAALNNTTSEVSLLGAAFSMPRPNQEAIWRVAAAGLCRCTAGGPVDLTWRLKNLTDTTTLASATVQLATDTDGNRPWRFDIIGEGNVVIGTNELSVADLRVGVGNTDTFKQAMGQGAVAQGSDPQNWDITAQASVANAGILVFVYSAQIIYALPGA